MVLGDLLTEPVTVFFKEGEVADEVKEAVGCESAADEISRRAALLKPATVDAAPALKPLEAGGERTEAGVVAVGDDEGFVVDEEVGDLVFVGLQLVVGVEDGCVLVGGVLQLEDGEGQAVDEKDDVGAAGFFEFGLAGERGCLCGGR